jgi:hypothetical protein
VRQPENVFIASVHKHLPADLYRIKNNNLYNGGQADCWYSGKAGDLWVEYKFISLPKKDDTMIDLISGKSPGISHLQQNWLTSRFHEGRNVGVIVGCKEGGVWFSGNEWNTTYRTSDFKRAIAHRSVLASIIINRVGLS